MSGNYEDYDYDQDPGGRSEPAAPRRKSALRRVAGFFNVLFALGMVAVVCVAAAFFLGRMEYNAPGPLTAESSTIIAPGSGLSKIAHQLEDGGFISDARLFMAAAFLQDAKSSLKAGEYKFAARTSMNEILDDLVVGRSVQHKITIPEGLTTTQIVDRVLQHEVLVGELESMPEEGTLLPDTYVFLRGTTRKEVIARMQAAQKSAMEKLWNQRTENLPFSTRREAVILASIVEKETGLASERGKVAGVFVNRLAKKIRLQSDPTIIYGIVGGKGILDRPIRKSDIAKKTPYNTYQIDGLPPTPIANPGIDALKAVLQPVKTDALYFVADGTGGHAFAKTLKEHRANVRKWRKIERERKKALEKQKEEQESSLDADRSETPRDAASLAAPPPPPPLAEKTVERETASAGEDNNTARNPFPSVSGGASLVSSAKAAPAIDTSTVASDVKTAKTDDGARIAAVDVEPEEKGLSVPGANLGVFVVPVPRLRPERAGEIQQGDDDSEDATEAQPEKVTSVRRVRKRVAPAVPKHRRQSDRVDVSR